MLVAVIASGHVCLRDDKQLTYPESVIGRRECRPVFHVENHVVTEDELFGIVSQQSESTNPATRP